jgi:hypothetical protein
VYSPTTGPEIGHADLEDALEVQLVGLDHTASFGFSIAQIMPARTGDVTCSEVALL